MERAEWLKQMREMAEALYDHFSPEYWVRFGLYENAAHREYLQKFLERVPPHSSLLSAACGAGRYDGFLFEAGHSVVGLDQSAGMLARAREQFPEIRYEKMGLQEMDFHEVFDGAICMDAMEHIPPEDYPVILRKFQEALKPGAPLNVTGTPGDSFVTVNWSPPADDGANTTAAAGAPTVTGVSPTSGPQTGGNSVTITGTNLSGATAVNFGVTVVLPINFTVTFRSLPSIKRGLLRSEGLR